MPVKDLKGPPRQSAAERSRDRRLMAEIMARTAHLRRDRPGDDSAEPAERPDGPRPLPLSGAAALDLPD